MSLGKSLGKRAISLRPAKDGLVTVGRLLIVIPH
jgi:hypothetical protein